MSMEMQNFCYSCGAPTDLPQFKSSVENYCVHCVNEEGKLKPFEEIQAGCAMWFRQWQPGLSEEGSMKRAWHYMMSMPAWAEDK